MIYIYICKGKKNKQKTEKKIYIYIYISTVATVPLGTVATVQNWKKKNG